MIDAGMRELYQTGYMHNRVRMVVGSFLVKNLLIDWREGERWFWDTLLDADMASNSAGWQWVAGSGADAAPFFRIFNPILQGEKFDKDGEYVKKYCPELKRLPNKFVHKPWEAPPEILKACGVELGKNYPKPIVDLKLSRTRALDALAQLKVIA
jgi:deoxyribodipyrimidine photo-lyase